MLESLRGLSHVGMKVSDIDRSVAFYQEVFGWTQLFDLRLGGSEFEAAVGVRDASGRATGGRIGDLRLEFATMSWWNFTPAEGLGISKLSFEVTSVADACHELGELGIEPVGAVRDDEGCRIVSILDPDSQLIDFIEYMEGGSAWGGEAGRHELRK